VKRAKEYELQFSALSIGLHRFTYSIDKEFFGDYLHRIQDDARQISDGLVDFNLNLDKKEYMLALHFEFKGWVSLPCDKCLDPVRIEIDQSQVLHVRFSDAPPEDDGEIIYLPNSAYKLSLADLLFEYIQLALPARHIHLQGTCNPEKLAALQQYLVEELPDEVEQNDASDPRWEILKKLKN
jgi:uncharacterized metal-binding protein YceD (DUF177 family)